METIELYAFRNHAFDETSESENIIEEYEEYNPTHQTQAPVHNKSARDHSTSTSLQAYDFFTKVEVKSTHKETKKKRKKREKPLNLTDVITSELSQLTIPVRQNVITTVKVDNKHLQQPTYMQNQIRNFEERKHYQSCASNLSPQFSNIYEADGINLQPDQIAYIKPVKFQELQIKSNNQENAKFLDIEIKEVKIKHHHKFSLEHLLAVKLVENYNEYIKIETLMKEVVRDINVNRETKDYLKEDLLKVNAERDDIRFDKTVRKYTKTLLELKDKHLKLLDIHKGVIHKLFSLWSDIQTVREKSEIIQTPYELQVLSTEIVEHDFEKEWNDVFCTEYADKISKIEYDYVTNYLQYKQEKLTQKGKLTKPRLDIDEEEIRKETEEVVNRIVTRDKIQLVLITNKTVPEKKIIKSTFSFKIYVDDIFVCDSESIIVVINYSFGFEVNELLTLQILPHNKVVTIVLVENDENIALHEVEITNVHNGASIDLCSKSFICNNIIKPSVRYVGSGHNIKEIIVANKVRLKSGSLFKEKIFTNYEANMKILWNEKLSKTKSKTLVSYMATDKLIRQTISGVQKPNLNSMVNIINTVYDRDINNCESIINTLSMLCKINVGHFDKFSIEDNHPDAIRHKLLLLRNSGGFYNIGNKAIPLFASQISTEQLTCLQECKDTALTVQLLNEKSSEMDPIELQRLIGVNYIQKLNKDTLQTFNDRFLKKTYKDVVRDFRDFSLRGIFSRQTNFTSLTTISKTTKQQLLNEALLKEQEIQVTVIKAFNLLDRSIPIISEDKEGDNRIAGVKVRPLRPFVKISYRDNTVQTAKAIGCHPIWNQTLKFKAIPEPLSSIHLDIYDEHKIILNETYPGDDQSFHSKTVQYRFHNKWLGTVKVPLYNVFVSGSVREVFKVSTPPLVIGYDHLLSKNESTFSIIPEVTKILKKESSFICVQISTSLSHLGKIQDFKQPVSNFEDDYVIKHLNRFVTDYTNDFPSRNISLTFIDSSGNHKCVTQFLQPIPPPDSNCFNRFSKARLGSALSKSSARSKSSSSRSSGGKKRTVDIESGVGYSEEKDSVYNTHESQNWRTEEPVTKIMYSCLRYVSLIPSYEVMNSHIVTLKALELLKVLYGSSLDHTMLLASYFIYLGVKCWVVIGFGVPNGLSSYVLTKYDEVTRRVVMNTDQVFRSRGFLNKTDGFVWYVYDAVNGERFELRDVSCPLKSVDYVFDNENIWVNMQSTQNCESVSFNFTRTSDWKPVFDKNIFVIREPVINDSSFYSLPIEIENLRQTLENKLKAKIQKWRSHNKTVWNRYCSSLLREVLPFWEAWSFSPTEQKPGLGPKLKQLMLTYQVYGFPLNIPYASTKSVISTVNSTGVHMNDDPTAEFALAVEVYAYPNNVLSVWVFLTSICKV